jgi:cell division protein FtsW
MENPRPSATLRAAALSPVTLIVVCALALSLLGLTILFSASAPNTAGPFYYLKKQLLGFVLATGACLLVSRLNLDYLRRYAWHIGIAFAVLLLLVLVPPFGKEVNGARRWLNLGFTTLQVSELAKFGLIFCLAHYLAQNQTRLAEFRRGYLFPLAIVGVFTALIAKEPDYGTAALTLAVGVLLLFLAGARWRYIVPTVLLAVGIFAVMVVNNPNRLARFTAYLDLEGNKSNGTYQLYQALVAFAVGGAGGVGVGQGRQQINFLPEAHTDFIFPVLGEELGLGFTLAVVALFTAIFVAGLIHLRRAPNLFQFLLTAGSLLLICMQAIINIGVVTGLLPTKGMSLPFISAGLSNLLLMGILLGVLINTERTWGRAGLPGRSRGRGLGLGAIPV